MSFRLERTYPGIGVVRRMTDLTDELEIEAFRGLMAQLALHRPRLVEMFRDKKLSARDLLRASADERLGKLLPDERLVQSLWPAVAAVWKRQRSAGDKTVARYKTSATKLERMGPLVRAPQDGDPPDAPDTVTPVTVLDLGLVDWDAVADDWDGSASDWMHCFRMLSRFLTLHLGGGTRLRGRRTGGLHPWRLELMDRLPRKTERKRVPSISPALFFRLVDQTPEYMRPSYMTLVITGFRTGEYLALGREHLRPDTFEIAVPGTKTEASEAVLPVDPALWPWIDQAVPSPVRYKMLRLHWRRACDAEGLTDVRLHDLRHCTGQWASSAGVPEAMVQAYLRHADPETTRRYTMQTIRAEVATTMARILSTPTARPA